MRRASFRINVNWQKAAEAMQRQADKVNKAAEALGRAMASSRFPVAVTCRSCEGRGMIFKTEQRRAVYVCCKSCHGLGLVKGTRGEANE